MSRRIITNCDSCGVEKQESNHWFSVHIIKNNKLLAGFQLRLFSGFSKITRDTSKIQDYCGLPCVYKAMQKWADAINKSLEVVADVVEDSEISIEELWPEE